MKDEAEERIRTLRETIDVVDDQIVELLNQRAGWALKIGEAKRRAGAPVYEPEREDEVIRRVSRKGRGPLAEDALRRLFERIIDESRSLERTAASDDKT